MTVSGDTPTVLKQAAERPLAHLEGCVSGLHHESTAVFQHGSMLKERTIEFEAACTVPGEWVPVVQFDYGAFDAPDEVEDDRVGFSGDFKRARRETVVRLLQFLTDGVDDPKDIGRRALMALHEYNQRGTLKMLAQRMRVTEARACQLYRGFKNLSR